MNLTAIITSHQAEKEEKDLNARAQMESVAAKERQRIALNAEVVKGHFKTVIEPVLDIAQQQISEAGKPCRLETTSIRLSDKTVPTGIGLNIKIGPDEIYLGFFGCFDSMMIEVSEKTGQGKAIQEQGKPLRDWTREAVEKRLEEFVRAAFPVNTISN